MAQRARSSWCRPPSPNRPWAQAKVTSETLAEVRRRCAGRTVLFVTHDPTELEAMGAVQRLELS